MKTYWTVAIVAVVLIGGFFLLKSNPSTNENTGDNNQTSTTTGEGRVFFSITDAAASMGNISEVKMTVGSVEMYNQTKGWVSVSTAPKTYNLLELKSSGKNALVASFRAAAGTYNQVRLRIDKVVVRTKNNTEENAALVSSSMTLNSSVRVNANEDSSVNIDVLADKSLYTTTKGGYVFAPNVKVESRSDANVTTNSDSTVIIDGGTVESSGTYGMNLEGNMILNFRLDVNASFDVTGNVLKVIMGTTTTTIDLKL